MEDVAQQPGHLLGTVCLALLHAEVFQIGEQWLKDLVVVVQLAEPPQGSTRIY